MKPLIECIQFDLHKYLGTPFTEAYKLASESLDIGTEVHSGEPKGHLIRGHVLLIENDKGLVQVWRTYYDTSD